MKIPDRWIDYKAVGDVIDGTRFINFKVPLKEPTLKANLPKEEWLTTKSLIRVIKEKGYNLGLVIDLTNTKKYYNKEDFEKRGIQYVKIFTEGHKVPSKMVQDRFKEVVNDFLESNDDKDCLIGVHCTHGLNRTGYLVCRYLIDGLDFEPNAAIEAFNKARGHTIERENYLADLRGQRGKFSEEEDISSGPDRFYSRGQNNHKRFESMCDERPTYHNVHSRLVDDYGGFGRSYISDEQQTYNKYDYSHRHSYETPGCSSVSSGYNEGYRPSINAYNGNQVSRGANKSRWTSNSHQEHDHLSHGATRAGWSSRHSSNKSSVSTAAESAGWTYRNIVRNEKPFRNKHSHRESKDEMINSHRSSGKKKHHLTFPYSLHERKGGKRQGQNMQDGKTYK